MSSTLLVLASLDSSDRDDLDLAPPSLQSRAHSLASCRCWSAFWSGDRLASKVTPQVIGSLSRLSGRERVPHLLTVAYVMTCISHCEL